MNVYLAGKIRPGDWREELVPGLTCQYGSDASLSEAMLGRPHYAGMFANTGDDMLMEAVRASTLRWPVVELERCPGWYCVGPYFCDLGHSHEYAYGWHGWDGALSVPDVLDDDYNEYDAYIGEDRAGCRAMVHELNSRAIQDCDALVAWLDADDCYGTLAEIGYAARDKVIGIVTNDLAHFQEEHWFALQYAHVILQAAHPIDGVIDVLEILKHNLQQRITDVLTRQTMPYQEYLQTEWWQTVRSGALDRAEHRCQVCGANGTTVLDVHHNTYANLGAECQADLVVLCRACHSKHHDKPR